MRMPCEKPRAGLFKNQLGWPRFSIAEIMGLVAAAAVVCVWPQFWFPFLFVALVWLFYKVGLSLALSCILVLMVLSIVLPALMRPGVSG